MTDLAAIRERHVRVTKPTMEPDPADPTKVRQTAYCQWCATRRPDDDPRWPCETNQLLALLADTPSVEPLDVERLARALSFAHPGPWPGKLSSAEFARVVAGAYEHGYEAGKLPCTFHRPYDDSMCGRTEVDPIHPDPDERMGRGRHVYRHDPVEYDRLLPTQASDSPEKP